MMLSFDSKRGRGAVGRIAERFQVELFLSQTRALVAKGDVIIESRKKNSDCLAQLGLTFAQQLDTLRSLTVEDYCECPALDTWVFGVDINGVEVFVKMQAVGDPPAYVRCISFHEAENRMCYPHRK